MRDRTRPAHYLQAFVVTMIRSYAVCSSFRRNRADSRARVVTGELQHRVLSESPRPLAYELHRRIADEALGLGDRLLGATESSRESALKPAAPSAQRFPLFVRPRLSPVKRVRGNTGRSRGATYASWCLVCPRLDLRVRGFRPAWVRAKTMSESSATDISLRSASTRNRSRFGRWPPLDHKATRCSHDLRAAHESSDDRALESGVFHPLGDCRLTTPTKSRSPVR